MATKNYNPGKLWPIIKIARGLIRENPELLHNDEYLKSTLKANIEELNHPETCGNCGASMLEYIISFDYIDALLLFAMGRVVRERVAAGVPFTEANKIHVSSLETSLAIRCRTTQCSKLGLVAKLRGPSGRQITGTWVITARGFEALKGYKIPKSVRVWRGKIEERTEEKTTISQAFDLHREKVEEIIKKRKSPKSDCRALCAEYNKADWYDFGPTHEGKLF